MELTPDMAGTFAWMALRGIQREYPNKPGHVMNNVKEVKSPAELHPAFYGSFDWHSSVHGHWMLVRLLKAFPQLQKADEIRPVLSENLSAENIAAEVAYLNQPGRKSFERTYGWAWLLKLAAELHDWDDAQGQVLSRNLCPLAQVIVDRYLDFLPRLTYPIRRGLHPNTAFGLSFAYDYAQKVNHQELELLLVQRSRDFYLEDTNYPAQWEPDGDDFFSPSLIEADLMRRILKPAPYVSWLHSFLPGLQQGEPHSWLNPVAYHVIQP